jgi:thioredoxin-related protein
MRSYLISFLQCLAPALPLALCLASCGKLKPKIEQPEMNSPFGGSGVPPMLRAKDRDSGTPVTPGGNVLPPDAKFTPEEDIIFTDPDQPDTSLPELSSILAQAPEKRGPWEESETIAKKLAAREGKPLLIWFTDSARSPTCKTLSQELFATPQFEQWAAEKIIRLKVDSNINVKDPDLSLDETQTRQVEIKNHVTRLKKRYKVLGHPSLIILNPSGEVIARPRGYKRGQADYLWGVIKQNEIASAHAHKQWKAKLEKKGYRDWHDRRGRGVFAKLTGYSNGTLTLIEPDGTRSRTKESKLSDEDREWIAEQKRLRGLD